MARWHKVGEFKRNGRVVYEADERLHDPAGHAIVPGDLITTQKVHLVTEASEIRGTWPMCRRLCTPFLNAEVRFAAGARR